jgi:hypothetical protein
VWIIFRKLSFLHTSNVICANDLLFWCYSQQQCALHDLRLLALLVIHLVALQDSVCLHQPSVMVDLTVRISQMRPIVVSSVSIVLFCTSAFQVALCVVDVLWNHVSLIYINLIFLICSCCFVVFFLFCFSMLFRIPWLYLISYLFYCSHSDPGADVHVHCKIFVVSELLSAFLFICSLAAITLAAEQPSQLFFYTKLLFRSIMLKCNFLQNYCR